MDWQATAAPLFLFLYIVPETRTLNDQVNPFHIEIQVEKAIVGAGIFSLRLIYMSSYQADGSSWAKISSTFLTFSSAVCFLSVLVNEPCQLLSIFRRDSRKCSPGASAHRGLDPDGASLVHNRVRLANDFHDVVPAALCLYQSIRIWGKHGLVDNIPTVVPAECSV
jgi:hypothetical protein